MRGRDLGRLDDQEAVAARGAERTRTELTLDLIDRGLRVELTDGVLERPEPDLAGDVG
jgi:hypothetical protein